MLQFQTTDYLYLQHLLLFIVYVIVSRDIALIACSVKILRQFSVAQLLSRFQSTTAFIFWILVFIFDIFISIVHL